MLRHTWKLSFPYTRSNIYQYIKITWLSVALQNAFLKFQYHLQKSPMCKINPFEKKTFQKSCAYVSGVYRIDVILDCACWVQGKLSNFVQKKDFLLS